VVESALDGLEVATHLAAANIAIIGSRTLRDAARRLAALEPGPAIVEPKAARKGQDVAIRVAADPVKAPGRLRAALLARRAIAVPEPAGFAAKFAWPFAAGRAQLLAWIEQVKASHVFVTGACAQTIARAVGKRARVLGPPEQMPLFEDRV